MTAYQNQYYSTSVMLQTADALHMAAGRLRAAAKALHAWHEKRRRAAIARHEFERMSDRSLRDIGLSRADLMRAAWGVERTGDPAEAIR
jgi:uncharacterized protein YjiS (DUF1127 family)